MSGVLLRRGDLVEFVPIDPDRRPIGECELLKLLRETDIDEVVIEECDVTLSDVFYSRLGCLAAG